MGFLNTFRKKTKETDWNTAYSIRPHFYRSEEGIPFGVLSVTESTDTILPRKPQMKFLYNGNTVSIWKIAYASTTTHGIIGDEDYFMALDKIERFCVDSTDDYLLVRGLTLTEMTGILNS